MKNVMQMPTIGIAGVGLPSTIYCIDRINHFCQKEFPLLRRPHIVMHTPNLEPTYLAESNNQWHKVAGYLSISVNLLAEMGADFAIIPANSVHNVITQIQNNAAIKVLDLLTEVADVCQTQGFKKVGIVGTKWTMTGHYYQSRLAERSIIEVIPTHENQEIFHSAIMEELVPAAMIKPKTMQYLLHAIELLKDQECDAIVLACTELPLVLNEINCGLPVVDTTTVLAQAAIRETLDLLNKKENQFNFTRKQSVFTAHENANLS